MRSWQVFAIIALLIAGIAAAGWLISRNGQPAGVAQTAQAGDLRVTMRVDAATVGTRVLDITVEDSQGQPADVAELRLRFAMRDMNMGQSEVLAQPIGRGHFQARGQFFSMAGNWGVEAVLLRQDQQQVQAPFTLAIAAPGEQSGPANPIAANAASIQAGQKLYAANCQPCHGSAGRGDGPAAAGLSPRPADFAQHMGTGMHTDGQIYLWIKNGFPNSAMPAWDQRLSDEQIWQLVGYLRTFAPPLTAQASGTQTQANQNPTAAVPLAQQPLPPIVFARQGNIWRSAGQGGAPQPITSFADGSYAEYPAFSPDGGQIAFVVITPPPVTATLPLPSSTLYVMNADGSGLKTAWKPAQGQLGLLSWAPDGQSILVAANGVQGGSSEREIQVLRLDLASGVAKPLLADALDPTLSRDGRQLAFLKLQADGYTMSLTIAAADGSAARQILDGANFQGFYAPRFTPDGNKIVLAAVGGPNVDSNGKPVKARAPGLLDRALGWLAPATAEAHGQTWELWSVNTDGSGLRRITSFGEDLPMVAFSPDGTQAAVMGYGGIYVMAPDGSGLHKIDLGGDHGGLDWAR